MPKFEDDRRKIVARLELEGWTNIGGKEHDNFVKPVDIRRFVENDHFIIRNKCRAGTFAKLTIKRCPDEHRIIVKCRAHVAGRRNLHFFCRPATLAAHRC